MSTELDRCAVIDGPPCPATVCPCRSPKPPPPLVCQGRPVDDAGQPIGEPCGKPFRGPEYVNDGRDRPRRATAEDVAEHARAAGWSVAGPPCCPRCRRPDPDIARGLTRPAPADRSTEPRGTTK